MGESMVKGRRLTGDARIELARDLKTAYDNGASVRQLAAQAGRSYGAVHALLVQAGTELRARGGRPRTGD
jgi:Helix-turn-helix domain